MSDETKVVEVPAKFQALVSEIEKMSVLDLSELVKVLEEKFGVTIADEELGKIKTVQDAVDAIAEKKG